MKMLIVRIVNSIDRKYRTFIFCQLSMLLTLCNCSAAGYKDVVRLEFMIFNCCDPSGAETRMSWANKVITLGPSIARSSSAILHVLTICSINIVFHDVQSQFWKMLGNANIHETSSNGNISHVTGHLCGEFTGHRWIRPTKASDARLWCFLWSGPEWMVE